MANVRRPLASFPKDGSSRNSGANQGTCWMILGRLNFSQNILVPQNDETYMNPLCKLGRMPSSSPSRIREYTPPNLK